MNGSGDPVKPYLSPPPSYDEAVFGIPPAERQTQYVPTQLNPSQYQIPHYATARPQPVCPPGVEPLLHLSEVLIYPAKRRLYTIKNSDKIPVFTAKEKNLGGCCDCSCDCASSFTLRPVNSDLLVAQATRIVDSVGCCFPSSKLMEVKMAPEVAIGTVRQDGYRRAKVMNQSDDLLYTLYRESGCCDSPPFQIFTPGGAEVGQIDNSRGIKNRLTLPQDIPIQHKLLLLFTAIAVQCDDDESRDS